MTVSDVAKAVDTSALIDRPISDWRPILAQECQVYVFGENYIAKRFDQINFKFCEKNEAKEIIIDNLYALLRYKYFPQSNEKVDETIQKIVQNFTLNLKSTLKKVSFDVDTEAQLIKMIPDYCVAFRNGVYDFKNNNWLFKYSIVEMENIKNRIYLYSPEYAILWYLNFDFEPLPININEVSLSEFIDLFKELTKEDRNYCFELLWNISHNIDDKFEYKRFVHLCEILGYLLLPSFCQHFVFLIGSGQNGKNSLFDGCFTHKVIPKPAANDIESFETDKFITGALENKAHNIFLETSPKTHEDSKMLKAITGSTNQTIEQKGVQKYSGYINCKYIWSGNDQEKIKFADTTQGFRRRINMLEIWYSWDAQKRFLKRGDYYDTTFSDSLSELKNDISNIIAFVYFGMYGLISATRNFTQNFKFTQNDWKLQYSDVDINLKDKIESVSIDNIVAFMKKCKNSNDAKTMLYDINRKRLYENKYVHDLGYSTFDEMLKMLESEEDSIRFFSEHDIYINVRSLQSICGDLNTPTGFTQALKKLYNINVLPTIYNNKPYIKGRFIGRKLKIIA